MPSFAKADFSLAAPIYLFLFPVNRLLGLSVNPCRLLPHEDEYRCIAVSNKDKSSAVQIQYVPFPHRLHR